MYRIENDNENGEENENENDSKKENENENENVEKSKLPYEEKTKITYNGNGQTTLFRRNTIEPDFENAFSQLLPQLRSLLERALERYTHYKFQLEATILFRRSVPILELDDEIINYDNLAFLWSTATRINLLTDIDEVIDAAGESIMTKIEQYTDISSNYYCLDCLSFKVLIFKTNSLQKIGSFIKLPSGIN